MLNFFKIWIPVICNMIIVAGTRRKPYMEKDNKESTESGS